MEDRRGAEGVEHLQAAARELLGAARAFLDVVEEVVEDPDRLSGAAAGVSDLVRSGLGLLRTPQPWEQGAWDAPDGESPHASAHGSVDSSWWDEPFGDAEEETPAQDEEPAPAAKTASVTKAPAKKTPAKKAAAKKAAAKKTPAKKAATQAAERPSRVRRIAVD